MLTDAGARQIQRIKGTAGFSMQFIKDFDSGWDAAVQRLRESGGDLSQIPIAPKETNYRKGDSD